MEKINATCAILTYNSGKTLEACLESVKDFKEIILIDGGSTDNTKEIGEKYGAKIVNQSNPGNPIQDFAKERNIGLNAATKDWFFYIDSDEVATKELIEDIREIVQEKDPEFLVYSVQYKLVSADYKQPYTSFKSRYQTRFFNKKSGATFIKEVHERIEYNKKQVKTGTIESCWLVPLDTQLSFKNYAKKIHARVPKMTKKWNEKNPLIFIYKALLPQVIGFLKQIVRIVVLRIREPWNEIVPLRYELYRLYTPVFTFASFTKRYIQLLLGA